METNEQNVLLKFSNDPKDYWTIEDSLKGTCIYGSTGSGKTSGSGRAIAIKFLKEGWGGLVLCAKTDEVQLWKEYCSKAGRTNDLIIFEKNSVNSEGKIRVFNPLHYEMNREGEGAGEIFNITNIFMNLNKMRNRASNEGEGNKEDRFWDNALKRIISRTIELLNLAGEEITYTNMINLIYTSPTEKNSYNTIKRDNFSSYVRFPKQHEKALANDYFYKYLAKAFNNVSGQDEYSPDCMAFKGIEQYFGSSLPNMSDHTHNAVIESFMGVCEPFLSGILNKHFSGETNLLPEEIYKNNKIIVLNFPVKEFLDAGIMAQSIFKLIFQQAIERRDVKEFPNPVFLWVDEAQYFLTPYDQIFLTTARSSKTATVFLSQSISNYFAIMGSGLDARAKVDSLMGNLTTKIFHANSDAETNEYASRLIGKAITYMDSQGSSQTLLSLNFQSSETKTAQYLPQIQPREFTTLRTGGENNNFEVDSVVFMTGKTWSNGKNFYCPYFKQDFSLT